MRSATRSAQHPQISQISQIRNRRFFSGTNSFFSCLNLRNLRNLRISHGLHEAVAGPPVVEGQPRVRGDVAVAGGVDDDPPQHGLAAGLGIGEHAADAAALDQRLDRREVADGPHARLLEHALEDLPHRLGVEPVRLERSGEVVPAVDVLAAVLDRLLHDAEDDLPGAVGGVPDVDEGVGGHAADARPPLEQNHAATVAGGAAGSGDPGGAPAADQHVRLRQHRNLARRDEYLHACSPCRLRPAVRGHARP